MISLLVKYSLLLVSILLAAALTALFGFIASRKPVRIASGSDASAGGDAKELLRAVILCNMVPPSIPYSYETQGFTDCHHANLSFGGFSSCARSCLGLGTCVEVCPSSAIRIGDGRIAVTDACSGCGKCVDSCPRNLIRLIPLEQRGSIKCAGVSIPETVDICETAKTGHFLDYRDFPESFFKNLDTWGIIRKKSRYE